MTNRETAPLPDRALAEVKELLPNLDEFVRVVEHAKTMNADASPEPLYREIARHSALSFGQVSRNFNTLENFRILEERGFDLKEVLDEIEERLDETNASTLRERRMDVLRCYEMYKDNHPAFISVKAHRLSLSHENLYLDSEIFTDARPVFDVEGRQIREFIISHMLAVRYRDATDRRKIHLSLDAADLSELRRECDRALVKAQALKTALDGNSWSVRVVHDDDEAV